MTKREREGSITNDDYDSQSLEVARQVGSELFTNLLLDDLVIDSGSKPDVNNVARGSDQPCCPDCFTHAMVDDSRRIFPRSVLQADTIIVSCGPANVERTSWSTQRFPKFWGLRDEFPGHSGRLRPVSLKYGGQLPWSARRSFIMDDRLQKARRGPDCDEKRGRHVGRNPRITRDPWITMSCTAVCMTAGPDSFRVKKNVVIMVCKNGRRRSVANAELWSNTSTRYGRLPHSVSLLHLSELDFL